MSDHIFYIDPAEAKQYSYSELLGDLRKREYYFLYCKSNNYYQIFQNLILSVLLNREIILLDSDFSDEEIGRIIGDEVDIFAKEVIPHEILEEINEDNLLDKLMTVGPNWKVTLFTSGTTGLPKKMSHSFLSITRYVRKGEKHSNDIWGFAYNPTHMAGLQVFFQALLNGNTIVRLFAMDSALILNSIKKNQISNISATPTFYRLLFPIEGEYCSVRKITSGGEKFDKKTLESLQSVFPNAKIMNVYASTEAGTLFASNGDCFSLKENMTHLISIRDNELYLHKSLLGDSSDIKLDDDWYATGDLIEVISDNPMTFRFVSRKNEMINVGGYKVNPNEVEEVLCSHSGIKSAFVFGKKNILLGNVICCQVVLIDKSITENQIRTYLSKQLQEFKIPRIINFVDHIQITRTGKLSRK